MNKALLTIGILACSFASAFSQTNGGADSQPKKNTQKEAYESFRKKAQKTYEDFREQANLQYADFLRGAWQSYELFEPMPLPEDQKIEPIIFEEKGEPIAFDLDGEPLIFAGEERTPETNSIEFVVDLKDFAPAPKPQPIPLSPIKEFPWAGQQKVEFDYYGTKCNVRFDEVQKFDLGGKTDKDAIADRWTRMSKKSFNNTIRDCLGLREALNLNDWAYLTMLENFATAALGEDKLNEIALMTGFIYTQSGYRMRLFKSGNELRIMFGSDYFIPKRAYLTIDGVNYFCLHDKFGTIEMVDFAFPKEQSLSLAMPADPILTPRLSEKRVLQSKKYPSVRAEVSVDLNLIDFFNDYPTSTVNNNFLTKWAFYANTPIDPKVQNELYPQLKQAIDGNRERLAVNKLLNFVQTAFDYGYDNEIWGEDRAFFAEETLHYPKSDCEDRAILFTHLVRELVGSDAVLIYYPGHLGAAVALEESYSSDDYITVNGKKFVITDPTFIGASVGRSMPSMPPSKATAILLD